MNAEIGTAYVAVHSTTTPELQRLAELLSSGGVHFPNIKRDPRGNEQRTAVTLTAHLDEASFAAIHNLLNAAHNGLPIMVISNVDVIAAINDLVSHYSSPIPSGPGAVNTSDTRDLTVSESTDIPFSGVGGAGGCQCGTPASSSEDAS